MFSTGMLYCFWTLRSWKQIKIAKVWTVRGGKEHVVLQRSQQGAEKRRFHGSIDGFDSVTDSCLGLNTSPHEIQMIDSASYFCGWDRTEDHFPKLCSHSTCVLEYWCKFTWGFRTLWQLWQLVPQRRWVLVLWIQQENSLIVRIAVGRACGKEKKKSGNICEQYIIMAFKVQTMAALIKGLSAKSVINFTFVSCYHFFL